MTVLAENNFENNSGYEEEGDLTVEKVQLNEKTISLLEDMLSRMSNKEQIFKFKNIISTLKSQNRQLLQAI